MFCCKDPELSMGSNAGGIQKPKRDNQLTCIDCSWKETDIIVSFTPYVAVCMLGKTLSLDVAGVDAEVENLCRD